MYIITRTEKEKYHIRNKSEGYLYDTLQECYDWARRRGARLHDFDLEQSDRSLLTKMAIDEVLPSL